MLIGKCPGGAQQGEAPWVGRSEPRRVCGWTRPGAAGHEKPHGDTEGEGGTGGVTWGDFLLTGVTKKGRLGNSCLLTVLGQYWAQPLAYIKHYKLVPWVQVLFALHGAKETFQLIANIHRTGDSTLKHGWEIRSPGHTRPLSPVASIALFDGAPVSSWPQAPASLFTPVCFLLGSIVL